MKFQYLEVELIPGFNDAIALLIKGADVEVIVPSNLAYGTAGNLDSNLYTACVYHENEGFEAEKEIIICELI